MLLIKPSFNIQPINADEMLQALEEAGRTCYLSAPKGDAAGFIQMIIRRGHESVLEHEKVTVRIICDRGVSHELVRHRIASYSQESTRYCDYNGQLTFIIPPWCLDLQPGEYKPYTSIDTADNATAIWYLAMVAAELDYKRLREIGWQPQQARSILPNSLKTEIVATMNLREWRHFFRLRTAPAAHPQMREIALPLLQEMKTRLPVIFGDL